jgi:hypothetical protein
MLPRPAFLLMAFLTLAATPDTTALAHPGHVHKILGTVTMAAADHVMLKDRSGKDVTVKVTKDTKVRSKPALKVEQIKAGTRVVVTATEEKDKSFTATTIDVGAPRV